MKKLASFFGIGEEHKEEEDNIDLCDCDKCYCACASGTIASSAVYDSNVVGLEQAIQVKVNRREGKKGKKKS